MRIVVVGAYGLVGGFVVAELLAAGHAVVAVGRDVSTARRRQPGVEWATVDLGRTTSEAEAALLAGADALVNCAGALQDGARDDLQSTHVVGIRELIVACRTTGVKLIVQISALGISSPGCTAFSATKLAAEAELAASGLAVVILRPGFVLAPTAYGGSALLRGLAAFPFAIPVVAGGSAIQVVAAADLALVVKAALTSPTAPGKTIDVCHADRLTLADLLRALRAWLGFPAAPIVHCPPPLAACAAGFGDLLGYLGWRSPVRTTTLEQLRGGVEGDGEAARRELGVHLMSLQEVLSRHPAGVQERWFAHAYLLKPVTLAGLGLFWGVTGVIGLIRHAAIATSLREMGVGAALATALALFGAITDLALAVGVAVRRTAHVALIGMILVSAIYTAGLSVLRPTLWLDPYGSLLKTVPEMLLAAFALAVLDER